MGRRAKVVLYNPAAVFYTMPLALVALGSRLDRRHYDVRIVDARLLADPIGTLLAQLEGALCLGVTVLTGAPISDALRASRAAKERYPDLPVVWGGWHPSLFAEQTLAEPSIDVSVQGQGEETFAELVAALEHGADLTDLQGICHRVEDGIVRNPARPLADMNELPEHDYGLIDVERYFTAKGRRQLDYISSTGCNFRCSFCADPFVFGRRWTAVSPVRMAAELERLWRRYRFVEVSFQDETFFTHRKRVIEFAQEYLSRGLQFEWMATLRADQAERLTEEAFALCVRAGLRRVMVGVESGSEEMLRWMHKDITLDQVMHTARLCVKYHVRGIYPFIVGFPGETPGSVRATLDLARHLRSMSPGFETPIFFFKPYPGSAITNEVVARGYRLPEGLEGWADFDFIGSSGPWVSRELESHVDRFKFYNRFAGGAETWRRWPLQVIARWRCKRHFYSMPVEKLLVERLRPMPRLS